MAQNLQQYLPPDAYVAPVTRAWATTGNTDTVTDEGVQANSMVLIMPTSTYAGRWYVSNITPTTVSAGVVTPGTFTVTSTSSESQTTTTYKYYLI